MARVLFKTTARKEEPKMPPTAASDDTKESEQEPTARPTAVRRPLVRSTKKKSNKKLQKLRKRKKQRNIPRRHGAVYHNHRTSHSNNTYRNDNRRDSTWTIKGSVSQMQGVDSVINGGHISSAKDGSVRNQFGSEEYDPEDGDPDEEMDDATGAAPVQDN